MLATLDFFAVKAFGTLFKPTLVQVGRGMRSCRDLGWRKGAELVARCHSLLLPETPRHYQCHRRRRLLLLLLPLLLPLLLLLLR